MIEQLIQLVASKIGIDERTAKQAVGVVLGLLQKEGDASAVANLFGQIPGAADLAGEYGTPSGSGGLGGLMGQVSGMLGGNAGDAMSAMAAFKDTGLSMDQAKDVVPVIGNFLGENAGEDVMRKALESVPALKDFLG